MRITFEVQDPSRPSSDPWSGHFNIDPEDIRAASTAWANGVLDWIRTLDEADVLALQRKFMEFTRKCEEEWAKEKAAGPVSHLSWEEETR